MITKKFKVQLLTDVILNQKAETEGPNATLDFIPGGNFLGIVAQHYQEYKEINQSLLVFHSGKVRFGDAHPVGDGKPIRSLKVPAAMFYPKLGSPSEECYIHHHISKEGALQLEDKQLKQCRSGYYDFSNQEAKMIGVDMSFVLKSAYDSEKRTAKDGQMFGYQSLKKDQKFLFSLEMDNDIENTITDKIVNDLCGIHHLGRSRSAQYGLVKITSFDYGEIESQPSYELDGNHYVAVYADSRLIFMNQDTLQPTFHPTVEQLLGTGVKGKICIDLSQIRTFRYSPWNQKRQCFDADRVGIEKGSVIVVRTDQAFDKRSQYVGSYNNEGFGKVIYNPSFLDANPDGQASFHLVSPQSRFGEEEIYLPNYFENNPNCERTPVLNLVAARQKEVWDSEEIYQLVVDWMNKNGKQFIGNTAFASQWSSIRNIAMQSDSTASLRDALFKVNHGYLKHGVAVKKWQRQNRCDALERFFDDLEGKDDIFVKRAVINLTAEMAKLCRKEAE